MRRRLTQVLEKIARLFVDAATPRQPHRGESRLSYAAAAHDHKQAAIDYPRNLSPGDRYYLYVKPFDTARDKSCSAHYFHSFAAMIKIMDLPPRAKLLDVACGPGWLSEFLARSGYDVTGVDISPDMIQIARERLDSVPFSPWEGEPLQAQFFVHDTEIDGLGEQVYHAAVFFDSLHHFPDPRAALDCVFQALQPGGKLYIQEGLKPAPGSQLATLLAQEMDRYGTLEKPFDQHELSDLLNNIGYVDIQAYETINAIVKRRGRKTTPALRDIPVPMTNTILARKPGGTYDSAYPHVLKASLNLHDGSPPEWIEAGTHLEVIVTLDNTGDTLWLSEPRPAGGFVTLGTKLLNDDKHLLSDTLERTNLPHDIPPGRKVTVTHRFTVPPQPGSYWIKLDLIAEPITWFEDEGSRPLEFHINVRP